MIIEAGQVFPTTRLMRLEKGIVRDHLTSELFHKGTHLILGFPGAFSPVCDNQHLPSFVANADHILTQGVDTITGISVNDPWVIDVWEKHSGCTDKIALYSDGNADLAKSLGLEFNDASLGIGVRSHRYVIVVTNGIIKRIKYDRGMQVCMATDYEHTADDLSVSS